MKILVPGLPDNTDEDARFRRLLDAMKGAPSQAQAQQLALQYLRQADPLKAARIDAKLKHSARRIATVGAGDHPALGRTLLLLVLIALALTAAWPLYT